MKIYVASSWRNNLQPAVVRFLRTLKHEVYDFRNPAPGNNGFGWKEIDPEWEGWSPYKFVDSLNNPIAQAGFKLDMDALKWCDTCVLVLPCGRSAHLEAGYCIGAGKPTLIYIPEACEPELMYKMATKCVLSLDELDYELRLLTGARS